MGRREVVETSPTIVDIAGAGRLVASLGQAERCVSLNHDALSGGMTTKWAAIGVLDDASKLHYGRASVTT